MYLLLNLIECRRYPHPQLLYDPMTDNSLQILSPSGKKTGQILHLSRHLISKMRFTQETSLIPVFYLTDHTSKIRSP